MNRDFLNGGGEMGALMRALDWSNTATGPVIDWPPSLRTAVRVLLTQARLPMFIVWGSDLIFLYNDAYRQLLGTDSHPGALGRPARELDTETWRLIGSHVEQIMRGSDEVLQHTVRASVDGEITDWSQSYSPLDHELSATGVGGVLAVCVEANVDLERKIIRHTQARDVSWQVTPDLMGALNSRGYFETSNPAWMSVLGWTEEEVASMSIWEMLHPDDIARTRDGFNLTQQGQPAIRFPNRYRRKDGAYRWISWVGVPDEGMVYCTGRDITDEKSAEAALATAQDALRQAQKMEAVGQLTGGLAHDFNNLLAGISGSVEVIDKLLKRGQLADVDRYISAARSSTRRAATLTHRLLAFSRRQTLDPKPTDVNRLVNGMEELIRRTLGPAIELEVVGAGGLWPTKVDASQLESALLNLCMNARDAMAPSGGRLTIETANKWLDGRSAGERDLPPGQYVSLCVMDTGTGMSPEVIERAFDPFFTTKPIGEGTGLGLSMVYGFARQSGGQVRIYSELSKGTTMCIYLPRHLGAAEVTGATEAPEVSRMTKSGSGESVLVVDDEATIRMLVREVLIELGYKPLEAADGPSALEILQSDIRIDLLITDVGLPGGMNGRQIADAARKYRPKMKVLFITGYAENAVIRNGHLEAGMEILTKPFEISLLGNRIRDIIEKTL
jgi:PAS domain S-box-containing protein